ncbi:127_t:CDS:2 [Ambispora leptoticha]|uniref:127_t:CDS:1 n=1 Tax=Ambispora leptoticha TaxID=144679 RepID=A0A9N8VJM5_9GLOM|nr:127_t:CDS:2 [Ambispora leptoticha]
MSRLNKLLSTFIPTSKTLTTPSPDEIITLSDLQKESDDSCMVCPTPCQDHESYPRYLKIDQTSSLESTVKPYFRHVVISTGKSDWPDHIDEESKSFAACLDDAIKNAEKKKNKKNSDNNDEPQEKPPRIVITNSSRLNSDDVPFSEGNDILLFPDNILVPIILICSHRRRDKRCGVTGPILKSEFENVLRKRGLDVDARPNDGVGLFMTSHIGGHKFAGNLIVYRDGQGIWYGRVLPCHAKAIVEKTVIEGKVIKELYRGSMNGSFGEGKGGKLEW